ncbi:hypothetical protein C8E00_102360 [Chromohalobacter marismortui]|uniref:Uncharacterized protein n=1 Tax=Chromohalobacter marismortui TaxID=42055 RepID=A0A4R7NTS9_9GAMM|nr:hypothetical protein C8E00_102360 [Chromohalobacter marismortui]
MRVRCVTLIVDYVEHKRHGLATKILGGYAPPGAPKKEPASGRVPMVFISRWD